MTEDKTISAEAPPPPQMPDDSDGFRLAERAAYHILGKKGEDVLVLDLRTLSDVCDFFVIASGQADVQVRAIAAAVVDGLAADRQKPVGVEGENEGRWVLLDFVDVIVHVLKPDVRDYYQLERLWSDAAQLAVDMEHLRSAGFRERHPDLAGPAGEPAAAPGRPDES